MLRKISRLPVSWIVGGQNLLILACMSAAFAVFLIGLSEVKVNGPYYIRIKDSADLISDILPPPLYALETYMTVYQLARAESKTEIEFLENKITRLRHDFDTRALYWNTRALPANVNDVLVNESIPTARKMFAVIDVKFLPAVRAHDTGTIDAALKEITELYELHRAAVDKLVALSNETLHKAAADADMTEHSTMKLIYAFMILALVAAIAGVLLLFGANVRPLQKIMESLGKLAKGNGDIRIGDTQGRGEIPRMWRAVSSLREAVLEALHLKQALDEMPMNVMVADPASGVVTYINNATLKTLVNGQGSLAEMQEIPLINTHGVPGQSIISPRQKTPWHTKFKVGSETLLLRVDAITGKDGSYLAPLLTWEILKDESNGAKNVLGQQAIEKPTIEKLSQTAIRIGRLASKINDVARQSYMLALKAGAHESWSDAEKEKASDIAGQSKQLIESVTGLIRTLDSKD